MKIKNSITTALTLCAMLALIFDSEVSLAGCRQGIDLCVKSVIPALFPFLVLSPILTSAMNFQLPKRMHQALKLPEGADSLWIGGCLGGYPVGAQCIAQAAQRGQITRYDASRLMAFCCNCGPGFVFGVCSGLFTAKWAAWGLWFCHIAGSLLIGFTLPGSQGRSSLSPFQKISFMDAFNKGLRAMAQICGWVILFRCLLEFLQRWILCRLSIPIRVMIAGLLELTNGCFSLQQIQNEALRFMICEAMLCFGGLCVAMQTASVAGTISLSQYLAGKFGQSIISSILAGVLWSIMHSNWRFACGMAALFFAILAATKAITKNYSRNFRPIGV